MNSKLLSLSALFALVACSTPDQAADGKAEDSAPEATGAALSVDYFGDTDVVGFHFEFTRVACDVDDAFVPSTISANVDLVDGIFPGMIAFIESSLNADSKHLGADLFASVDPGCYDILAAPASAVDGDDWTPSADCSAASADGVEVVGGATTDVLLISQCVGDEVGGLDALVVLNHAPSFSVAIDEKFNYECEPVRVCATAFDVDDDPIEVAWTRVSGPEEFSLTAEDGVVVGFEDGHRVWEFCADIVTRWTDSYTFNATAYDLLADGSRIEDSVGESSNISLDFPIYTNWIEEPMCFDDGGDLVLADGVSIARADGCGWTDAETFYCSGAYDHMIDDDIEDLLCDGADLIEEALYPECD